MVTNAECLSGYERYLTDEKRASKNTLSSYLRDVRQFGEYIEADGVDYVTADEDDLCGYIDHLRQAGKSVATVFFFGLPIHPYLLCAVTSTTCARRANRWRRSPAALRR